MVHDDTKLVSSSSKEYWRWPRTAFYVLVLISAVFALLSRPYILHEVRNNTLEPFWILLGPAVFGFFFISLLVTEVLYAQSLKFRSLPLFPFIVGGVFLVVLAPSSFREYQARQTRHQNTSQYLTEMLKSQDARVRALVMMATSCSHGVDNWTPILSQGLSDNDPLVQEAAKQAIMQQTGAQFHEGPLGLQEARDTLKQLGGSLFLDKKSLQ